MVSTYNPDGLICNVNIQLEFLYTWLCCNKLSLNINKTSYTIFRPQSNAHNNLNNSLLINHEVIKSSEESTKAGTAKFLGIYIDKHLTWSQHIDYLCTSISKSVFAINRVKYTTLRCSQVALFFFGTVAYNMELKHGVTQIVFTNCSEYRNVP